MSSARYPKIQDRQKRAVFCFTIYRRTFKTRDRLPKLFKNMKSKQIAIHRIISTLELAENGTLCRCRY